MSLFKKLFGSKKESKSIQDPYADIPWMTDLRRQNLKTSQDAGFKPSKSLPTDLGRQLRPTLEIANRLHAIKALVLWLMVPEENLPNQKILEFIDSNKLANWMTSDEKAILYLARDDEDARNSIGWKFENAWPLAWYFGYEEPSITGEMMGGEQIQQILMNYTCKLDQSTKEWSENIDTISEDQLRQKEDLFYCIHNAVRSAQLGGNTVPSNFDPIGNGGVIHERRHSLTWMLSKGTDWDETDLST